ncbi:thrombospondin type 3 repeat-containing protein [Myxococcota bacterium]|nr:thrombospondin type 3 repeat-containing protein [Myxococcota bacterium]
MTARFSMLSSFVNVLLLVNVVQAEPVPFSVSVDQSFLGAGSDETSAWSPCPFGSLCPRDGETWGTDAPIDLSAIGISEGDLIELTAVGSFVTGRPNPFPWIFSGESNQSVSSKMIAVFSAEPIVTPCSGFTSSSCSGLDDSDPNRPRILSAIDAGEDYDTGLMGLSEAASFDTDIAEDFFVPTTGVEIVVPEGARYLWAAPHDDQKSTGPYGHLYYGNQSNGGFWIAVEQMAPASDTDGDGVGDGVDNCPLEANPGQEDVDFDGYGDLCDVCPDEFDPGQEDEDLDGIGDACECNPNPGPGYWEVVYDLAETPPGPTEFEITGTPGGIGDAVNLIGPGTMTVRYEADGLGTAGNIVEGGSAEIVQLNLIQAFTSETLGTVATTNLQNEIPDNRWNGNPGGVVEPGSNLGIVSGQSVTFFTSLSDYRTFGEITCSGSFCGLVPTGPVDGTISLDLTSLSFAAGGAFAGANFSSAQITLPADPDAQPYLTLKGAELFRTFVPGLPAEQCEADADGDGFPDDADNCPDIANDQNDVNGDGVGDLCQPNDDDGDGYPASEDNCPALTNPLQGDVNGNGVGDACEINDGDLDGWPTEEDNCSEASNPGQEDLDADGVGDACDNCPADPNPGQEDSDANGLGNACDLAEPPNVPGVSGWARMILMGFVALSGSAATLWARRVACRQPLSENR